MSTTRASWGFELGGVCLITFSKYMLPKYVCEIDIFIIIIIIIISIFLKYIITQTSGHWELQEVLS